MQSQKGTTTELVEIDGCSHSLISLRHRKLHKKKRAKMISRPSSCSESDSESGKVSDVSSVVSSKGSRSDRQYELDPQFPTFTG